ncbi:hypothetical protein NE237_007450 [Protea cynaroides]|uniref:Protein SAR DEFICIENT 1 n=1 Tax=Protea cynaroides TaxID=273540 RepID=A0A9Q0KPG6_9MAGN|nr:hypothetical protein NE237_007450 [Protea cynaroides]
MAGKRLLDESSSCREPDEPAAPKRMRTTPSFAAVIGEVVMVKSLQRFMSSLEPLVRRVVSEEVERGLRHSARSLRREPSLQIRAVETSTLTLSFSKMLSLPVFTASKIEDIESNPLQIFLLDTEGVPTTLPDHPIKVEIVVIDGDFSMGDSDNWTTDQFNSKIVRERTGKRPLLTGDVNVTIRDGSATIADLSFTDNSSWIRSRKFRLGARVAPGSIIQGVMIREAMTEAFIVKDHRGELYKKHHPPSLEDEVWRLDKIGKGGAFHRKLASDGIHTVQDLLKLWVVDSAKLRKILGGGMSEKTWEATIKHAKTCVLGTKLYIFREPQYSLIFNSICQVVGTFIHGQFYTTRDLTEVHMAHVEQLIREAYMQWNSLQEWNGEVNENALQPPVTGDMEVQYLNYHPDIARLNHHDTSLIADTFLLEMPNHGEMVYGDRLQNSTYFNPQIVNTNAYNTSDYSSDDGDSTPPPRVYFS